MMIIDVSDLFIFDLLDKPFEPRYFQIVDHKFSVLIKTTRIHNSIYRWKLHVMTFFRLL